MAKKYTDVEITRLQVLVPSAPIQQSQNPILIIQTAT